MEGVQIRHFAQLLTPLLFALGLFALAGNRFAKVGMTEGDVKAQIASTLAAWADAFGCDGSDR